MITQHLEIIRLFVSLDTELTINQIAKLIKRSYASTNKYVHDLIDEGVLTQKVIGSAILCALNHEHEQTIGLLTLNSIRQRLAFLKKIQKERLAKITEFIDSLEDFFVHCAYLVKSKITIVAENKEQCVDLKLDNFEVEILNKAEFEKEVRRIDLPQHIVLKNHEQFWRMISKATQK